MSLYCLQWNPVEQLRPDLRVTATAALARRVSHKLKGGERGRVDPFLSALHAFPGLCTRACDVAMTPGVCLGAHA